MEPQRFLCLRLPNWPVQAQRLRMRRNTDPASPPEILPPLALHTPTRDEAAKAPPADPTTALDIQLLHTTFPATRSGPAVIAVSQTAWNQGIRPGLPLAEARSLAAPLPTSRQKKTTPTPAAAPATAPRPKNTLPVLFLPWNPAHDRHELQTLSNSLRRFAPVVGLDSLPLPDSLLLNVTGCGPLFGGELELLNELVAMLRQEHTLHARAAIADSIAAAWALTHADQPNASQICIAPPNSSTQLLTQLPVAAARITPADLEILQHLGIRRIGQLLQLPVEDLPARLSPNCTLRVRQLRNQIPEQIIPLPETSPVAAAWTGDEPAIGLQDLHWILTQLSENIAAQLELRRLACCGLHCEFITSGKQALLLSAGLVRPERSPKLLAEVLTLRLEFLVTQAARIQAKNQSSKSPLTTTPTPEVAPELNFASLPDQPIAAVRLTAVSGPLPHSRQRRLFADDSEPNNEASELLGALLSRLAGRLGPDAVLTASTRNDPRPEYSYNLAPLAATPDPAASLAFEKQLRQLTQPLTQTPTPPRETPETPAQQPATELPPRPIRLLPEPLEINLEWIHSSDTATPQNSRATFKFQGRSWMLTHWIGPERIQTAWWTDAPCHRDYYIAVSTLNTRFWLFRDLHSRRWFLHGVCD